MTTPAPKHADLKAKFPLGDLREAWVTILKHLPNRAPSKRANYYGYKWRYRVACTHCGRITEVLHYSLVERIRRKQKRCRHCRHDQPDNKPLSFDYHLWVTPPWSVSSFVKRSDVR